MQGQRDSQLGQYKCSLEQHACCLDQASAWLYPVMAHLTPGDGHIAPGGSHPAGGDFQWDIYNNKGVTKPAAAAGRCCAAAHAATLGSAPSVW